MSARLQHLMLLTEQKAEEKRRSIYSWCLWVACLLALAAAFVVTGSVWYANGIFDGREIEKQRQAEMVKPAPANCDNWMRQCAAQMTEKWGRFKEFGKGKRG